MTIPQSPRWDLSNVYPALNSAEFQADRHRLVHLLDEMDAYIAEQIEPLTAASVPSQLAPAAGELIDRLNAALLLAMTIRSYISSFVSTDSFNLEAKRLQSEFDQIGVRLQKAQVRIRLWVAKVVPALPGMIEQGGSAQSHAFYLNESAEQSKYLMSQVEESLVAELNPSGAGAWGRLQGTITSQLSTDFELDGKTEKLSAPALINLRSHPDENVRRRAYQAETKLWENVREPLAAAMNGIKGTVNTLNRRRGRQDALHQALDDARIDRDTLNAMLEAMHDSFPSFRKYFRAKATRLGKENLAWWDLFAPSGKTNKLYTFSQASEFILEHFSQFTPELAELAKTAFERNWIDAEQRVGKQGGAFCMSLPAVRESRVLCNFDGTLDQVFTIAHELGHAFHNYCLFKAGKTPLQRSTPMTLAETASIMCETIVTQAALKRAANADEELSILETSLIGSSQVIVDIYSRYLFEKEVFERRAGAELSADDLCDIMERAQKATYGDGLDENYLHKYMWTWKSHYYSAGLSFYNFPYAFGLLFGTGLYAIYQQRGASFVPEYMNLLASTGEGKAADLAARHGIDIRQKKFWADSLAIIGKQIDRYMEL